MATAGAIVSLVNAAANFRSNGDQVAAELSAVAIHLGRSSF
jgi:hypothetical protein